MPAPASPQKRKTRASSRRSSQATEPLQDEQIKQQQQQQQQQPQQQNNLDDSEIKEEGEKGQESLATSRSQHAADEDRVKAAVNETRSILASLGPPFAARSPTKLGLTAFDIAPEHLSLHTIRDQLLSKSDRSAHHLPSDDLNSSPAKRRRRSSLSQIMTEPDVLEIDWATYKDWPEGIAEEETLMLDYFRKLKFIYLEQETKMRFLADVQDDVESGQEATVYSAADVVERERAAKTLKSQLVEAKALVRALRAEVDTAADELLQPWQDVEASSREAESLIKEIGDMELELAKIRAQSHGKGNVAAIAGREGPLTTAEAEEVCDAQIEEMQQLSHLTSQTQQQMDATKKDLVTSHKSLDRLNAERSVAEKYAAEAKLGMGVDGGRDLETERLCGTHSATLSLLKSLLGLESVEAVESDWIRLVYRLPVDSSSAASKERKGGSRGGRKSKANATEEEESITINLRFEEVGGRVSNVEILSPKGETLELSEASTSRLRALQAANDVPLIVHEVLSAF